MAHYPNRKYKISTGQNHQINSSPRFVHDYWHVWFDNFQEQGLIKEKNLWFTPDFYIQQKL